MTPTAETWAYARDRLASGLTYAACARATGINEANLREALPGYAPALRPAPAPAVTNLAKGRAAIMGASAEDLAEMLDMAFRRMIAVSPRLAADFLAGATPPPPAPRQPSKPMTKERLLAVVDATAKRHGLTRSDLLRVGRKPPLAEARQEAFWALRQLHPQPSLPAIGRLMNRDHTTVLHGVRQHERRMGLIG